MHSDLGPRRLAGEPEDTLAYDLPEIDGTPSLVREQLMDQRHGSNPRRETHHRVLVEHFRLGRLITDTKNDLQIVLHTMIEFTTQCPLPLLTSTPLVMS